MAELRLLDAGVDWLSVTSMQQARCGLMQQRALRYLRQEEKLGNKVRPWAMSGFIGYAAGSVQVGTRQDGTLVRLGGERAKEVWKQFHGLSDNCSRLDVQITVVTSGDVAQLIRKEYTRAKRVRARKRAGGEVAWFDSTNSSATIYLGQRTSERFGRIYNKEQESGLERFKGCARYEIELKGRVSWTTANWLSEQVDERRACIALVTEFARARLGKSSLDSLVTEVPMSIDTPRSHKMAPTVERSLQYIRACIRPTVRRLVQAGYQHEVLEALGITIQDNALQLALFDTQLSQEKEVKSYVN